MELHGHIRLVGGYATKVYVSAGSSYIGTTLTIPSTMNGYTVTSIGRQSSTYNILSKTSTGTKNTTITTVVIPSTVTTIGIYTFNNFTALTTISGADNVTAIANYAFQNCTSLTNIDLPSSLISIGQYAFNGCTGLTSISFPDTVTTINAYAFNGCTGLTGDLVIPSNVTTLGVGAFCGCTGLDGTLKIESEKLVSIPNYAFQNCSNLKIVLPSTIQSVGSYAVEGQTDIWIDGNKDDCNITFASNMGGSNTPFVHYTDCTHTVEISSIDGIKFINADTGEEFVSGEYDCESTINIRIEAEAGYSTDDYVIVYEHQGDYEDSENVYEKITGTTLTINSLQRNTWISVKSISNGLDLALRTYIYTVNGNELDTSRAPVLSVSLAKNTYLHTKYPVIVNTGDEIVYKIKVYNEGSIAGSANKISFTLPEGLEFVADNATNTDYGWSLDGDTVTTTYSKDRALAAYTGLGLPDSVTLEIVCKVTAEKDATKAVRLTSVAEISEQSDTDTDSTPNNFSTSDLSTYKYDEAVSSTSTTYVVGQEDDDDFENVVIIREVPITYTIKISKIDDYTLELLSGAKFSLYDEQGNEIQSGVTIIDGTLTFDPITTYGEGTDTYYISETETPEGYESILDGQIKIQVIKTILDQVTESYQISIICDLLETYVNTTIDESAVIPIYTKEQLAKIGSGDTITIDGTDYEFLTTKNYKLMNDIDLSGTEWTPIANNLTGIIDGNGKTIKGLTITDKSNKNVGLFATFSGVIQNLTLDDVNINIDLSDEIDALETQYANDEEALENAINELVNSYCVGGFVGNMQGGAILNCTVNGEIKSSSSNVGGFIGYGKSGYSIIIKNSTNNSNVTSSYYNVGGFIGASYSSLTIKDCENTGTITAGTYNAGGFVGYVESSGYSSSIVKTEYDKTTNTINMVIGNAEKESYYTITLRKIDADAQTETLIDGSKFSLCDENKKAISGLEELELTNGTITLDATKIGSSGTDTYYLKEISAPDGYQIINDYIKVTITKVWDGVNSEYILYIDSELTKETSSTPTPSTVTASTGESYTYTATEEVSYVNKATILNSTNSGNVVSGIGNASGFIAKSNCNVNITNCINAAGTEITAANHSAGFLSEAEEKDEDTVIEISESTNYGTITLTGEANTSFVDASGIVSYSMAKVRIVDSTNSGTVNGADVTLSTSAGIVANAENDVIISNCENTGAISATNNASGILGKSLDRNYTISITDSVNTGAVSSGGNTAGIVALSNNDELIVENCSCEDTTITTTASTALSGIVALSASDTYITNCSIENVTIKNESTGPTGGILGLATCLYDIDGNLASPVIINVEGCTATDVTIESNANINGAIIGQIIEKQNGGVEEVTIKDCKSDNISYEGSTAVSLIVSYIDGVTNLTIDNCDAVNTTIQTDNSSSSNVGMIVGFILSNSQTSSNVVIKNCDVEEVEYISALAGNLGGILGFVQKGSTCTLEISDCNVAKSNITSTSTSALTHIAGIVGFVDKIDEVTVNNCNVTESTITSTTTAAGSVTAGIIGYEHTDSSTLTNCTVQDSKLSATNEWLSGMVGVAYINTVDTENYKMSFDNCNVIDTSLIGGGDSSGTKTAGIISQALCSNVKIENSSVVSTSSTDMKEISGNQHIGTAVGYAQYKVTLDNYDVKNINIINKGTGTSYFTGGAIGIAAGDVTATDCELNNVQISIENSGTVAGFTAYTSGNITLTDCEISDITINNNGVGLTSGVVSNVSSGSFTSSGSTYNDITITAAEITTGSYSDAHVSGIVGYVNSNINMSGDSIDGIYITDNRKLSNTYTAGIVSVCGKILTTENINLSNVEITATNDIGGFAGLVNGNTYINSGSGATTINNIKLTTSGYTGSNNASGIVALSNGSGSINNVTINGITISNGAASARTGGILANGVIPINSCTVSEGTITNTYSGSTTTAFAGGIVGLGRGGDITSCKVSNTTVQTPGGYAGGIAGANSGDITDCSVDNSTIQSTSGSGFVGGIVGHDDDTITISGSNVTNSTISNVEGNIGGIAGFSHGVVDNCNVTEIAVTSTSSSAFGLGGIVGQGYNIETTSTVIKNCTVTDSTLSGTAAVGGIAGAAVPTITSCSVISTDSTNTIALMSVEAEAVTTQTVSKTKTVASTAEGTESSTETSVATQTETASNESSSELTTASTESSSEETTTSTESSSEVATTSTESNSEAATTSTESNSEAAITSTESNSEVATTSTESTSEVATTSTGSNSEVAATSTESTSEVAATSTESTSEVAATSTESNSEVVATSTESTSEETTSSTIKVLSVNPGISLASEEEEIVTLTAANETQYKTTISGTAYVGGIIGYGGSLGSASYLAVTITDCLIKNIQISGYSYIGEAIGMNSFGVAGLEDVISNFTNTDSVVEDKSQS